MKGNDMEFQTISTGDCGLFDLTRSIASTSRPANDAEVTHYARWLAMAEATVKRQEGAIGAMETRMMEAVGRALRAENALRAIEEREERGGQPYVMGTPIVEFRRAA